jgi:hypothetical protein
MSFLSVGRNTNLYFTVLIFWLAKILSIIGFQIGFFYNKHIDIFKNMSFTNSQFREVDIYVQELT